MTRETAKIKVELLDNYLSHTCQDYGERDHEAMMMAINALEQESQSFKWCTDCREYDQEKHCCHRWSKVIRDTVEELKEEYIERDVLDKIITEVEIWRKDGTNWSDIRLTNIEDIIDKYKAETEAEDGNDNSLKKHELNQLFNAKNMRRTNADNNDN